jgi:hypothetical protein
VAIRVKRVSTTGITVKASTAAELRSVLRRLGFDPGMATGDEHKKERIAPAIPARPAPKAAAKRPMQKPAKKAPKIPTKRGVKKAARKAAAKR